MTKKTKGLRNKRRGQRIAINHAFRNVDAFLREYALNISAGGVFIRTTELWPVGTEVNLNFSVILDDIETIEGEGRVVRVVAAGQSDGEGELEVLGPGLGVVFTSLTPASKAVLAKIFTRGPRSVT